MVFLPSPWGGCQFEVMLTLSGTTLGEHPTGVCWTGCVHGRSRVEHVVPARPMLGLCWRGPATPRKPPCGGGSAGECGVGSTISTQNRKCSCYTDSPDVVYLGWRAEEGDGTCQLFCSWKSLLRIPGPPAQALRLVYRSPSHTSQVFFKLLFLC